MDNDNTDQTTIIGLVTLWGRTVSAAALSPPKKTDSKVLVKAEDITGGRLSGAHTNTLFEHYSSEHPPSPHQQPAASVSVLLAPSTFHQARDHDVFAPLLVPAVLWPDGRLTPQEPLSGPNARLPWFIRDALEPSSPYSTTVGTFADFQEARFAFVEAMSVQPPSSRSSDRTEHGLSRWRQYWTAVTEMCKTVAGTSPGKIFIHGKRRGSPVAMLDHGNNNPNQQSLADLLTVLQQPDQPMTLGHRLAEEALAATLESSSPVEAPAPPTPPVLAHFDAGHPLATSQRQALHAAIMLNPGDTLPVTGPPGTGKTTLLRDIIATNMVRAALDEATHPPLTLAASSNNRAITNMLDAMVNLPSEGHPVLSSRWLPPVTTQGPATGVNPTPGYALWLSSYTKREQARRSRHAHALRDNDSWSGTLVEMEKDAYLTTAVAHYLNRAHAFRRPGAPLTTTPYSPADLKEAIQHLHRTMKTTSGRLSAISSLYAAALRVEAGLQPDEPAAYLAGLQARHRAAGAAATAEMDAVKVQEFSAEKSLVTALHNANRAVAASSTWSAPPVFQTARCVTILRRAWHGAIDASAVTARHRDEIAADLPRQWTAAKRELASCPSQPSENLDRHLRLVALDFPFAGTPPPAPAVPLEPISLGTSGGEDAVPAGGGSAVGRPARRTNVEDYLDRTLRHHLWCLAARYWEGRWLLSALEIATGARNRLSQGHITASTATEPQPPGAPVREEPRHYSRRGGTPATKEQLVARLGRWSMITPCLVSTWSNAFNVFSLAQPLSNGGGRARVPLIEAVDLVLADEAGQTTPEVGLAGLALASRAVIIGDEAQLEPIAVSTRQSDMAVAAALGLADRFDVMERAGLLPSTGSLMAAAVAANGGRSLILREHFRSLPDICTLVTSIAYGATPLTPIRRADEQRITTWAPVSWVPVEDGCAERSGSGRQNVREAQVLAAWLAENMGQIRAAWPNRPLEEIVGIITPYRAQVAALEDELKRCGIQGDHERLTVGTVSSLQGAERLIVLVSVVGTQPRELRFVATERMLNVTISRARDHVIIFGDPSPWDCDAPTALGRLAAHLFDNPSRRLSVHQPWGRPGGDGYFPAALTGTDRAAAERLTTLEEHRAALATAFVTAQRRLLIVSPYLAVPAIEDDNVVENIRAAMLRGVDVIVAYDPHLTRQQETGVVAKALLVDAGAKVIPCDRWHCKSLMVDDDLIIEGSFNWLSAVRDDTSSYSRRETSWRITGQLARQAIRQDFPIYLRS